MNNKKSDADIDEMLKTLVETQQINLDSVNKLSQDTKEILQKLAQIDWLKVEVKEIKERVYQLERQRAWLNKTILTVLIVGLFSLIVSFKLNQHTQRTLQKDLTHLETKAKKAFQKMEKKVEQTFEQPKENTK